MEKTYVQLNRVQAPEELSHQIVSRIRICEQKKEKTRVTIFACVAFVALVATIPAFENVGAEAARSGFTGYASLLFSDWGSIVGIWKVFGLSLAETAPIFATALCAAILFVFVWSLAQTVRYGKAVRLSLS